MINNFDLISKHLKFENKDEFYFLQIIQRKKDGNITDCANNGYRTIKTYYIYSIEQLFHKKDKIIELCNNNNARAYININVRNAKEVALEAAKAYIELVAEDNSYQGYRIYDQTCGKHRARKYKPNWIVDIDTKNMNLVNKYIECINYCRGANEFNFIYSIPTLHGYHLVTWGFDINQFKQELVIRKLDGIDIHKDNPTLLYFNPKNDLSC